MANENATALYQLVEAKLGSSLLRFLKTARAANKPFHVISFELMERTGVTVTHETIRRWVRQLEDSGDIPPSTIPSHRKVA